MNGEIHQRQSTMRRMAAVVLRAVQTLSVLSRCNQARSVWAPLFGFLVLFNSVTWGTSTYEVFVATTGTGTPRWDGFARFSATGTLLQRTSTPFNQTIFALGTDGTDLMVTSAVGTSAKIDRYSRAGLFLDHIATLGPLQGFVVDMEQDSAGNYFLVDIENNAYRFSSEGVFQRLFGPARLDLELDDNGHVYAPERNVLRRFDAMGNLEFTVGTPFLYPGEIEIDNATHTLFHINQQGSQLAIFDLSGPVPVYIRTNEIPVAPSLVTGLHFNSTSNSLFVSGDGINVELATNGELIRTFFDPLVLRNLDIVTILVPEPAITWNLTIAIGSGAASCCLRRRINRNSPGHPTTTRD